MPRTGVRKVRHLARQSMSLHMKPCWASPQLDPATHHYLRELLSHWPQPHLVRYLDNKHSWTATILNEFCPSHLISADGVWDFLSEWRIYTHLLCPPAQLVHQRPTGMQPI